MSRLARFMAAMLLCSNVIFPDTAQSEGRVDISFPVSQAVTAESIESALSLEKGTLSGITVTSLPPSDSGRLVCEGVEVEKFDYLPRRSLDWLVYEAYSENSEASFSFLPDGTEEASECCLSLSLEGAEGKIEASETYLVFKRAESGYFSDVRSLG